jgi:hypothetical protein
MPLKSLMRIRGLRALGLIAAVRLGRVISRWDQAFESPAAIRLQDEG